MVTVLAISSILIGMTLPELWEMSKNLKKRNEKTLILKLINFKISI